ncbi:hypothetical protein C1Y63_09345 [Corynebacterium sp. 13CS0277]|uniref:hypothetical protein n=1 Tax=Corynebacterium sp. 13CS0277 TaxID=2071994 RepID=UPI000D03A1B4|nr:hypothetical protein [Corynebacterium sp. 13CS0277]PRQ10835.1 hypothetical protein C1Y63_09345 [Corynebacterium sp. 13CS0277]
MDDLNARIIHEDTGREIWTAQQCAEHCGIARSSWSSGSTQGKYPAPAGNFLRGRVWFADEVIAWREEHPGRG